MKNLIIPAIFSLLVLFGLSVKAQAGPEGKNTAEATYDDGGNDVHYRRVFFNTSIPVLLSSTAANATLTGIGPITTWRFREIVNCSDGQLMILRNSTEFQTFSATNSVVLSSGPLLAGDVYIVPHQGEVWGIWSGGTTTGGACVEHTFWNENKRRN